MTSKTGVELTLERSIAAPVGRVFEALTSRDSIGRWFGPSDDFEVIVHAWDCRPGGRYRVEMKAPDGQSHIAVGRFEAVETDRSVSYTWTWEGTPPMDTLVTFRVEGSGGATKLTLVHEGFPAEEVRDSHVQGWTGSMERLERELVA